MRIVVAPDSWKDCLPAHQVAASIARAVRSVLPGAEVVEVPMADGGQGTVEALVRATGGRFEFADVVGPRGEPVRARFGLLGDGTTAVVEMAAASGLELVPRDERNPWEATTFGTGQLMLAAVEAGAKRLILGIGGSATNDGGAGVAQALGFRLLDKDGNEIGRGGGALENLASLDASRRDSRITNLQIDVACDVTNPLCGPTGASAVYGPQKGADPEMIRKLDANLSRWAAVVARDLVRQIADVPGAGAAGGLGAGLLATTNARLVRGVELVMEASGLKPKLVGAHLCITGEGSLDRSSAFGKTAVGVAGKCKEAGVRCVALAGTVRPEAREVLKAGIDAYFSVAPGPISLAEAITRAPELLADAAEQVVRLWLVGGASGRN